MRAAFGIAIFTALQVSGFHLTPDVPYGPRPSITCPAWSVAIATGDSLQAAITAKPVNTTFCLKAGVHVITAGATPRSGDVFIGEYGAILDGSTWRTTDSTQAPFTAQNADVDNVTIRNLEIRNMPQDGIHAFKDFSDGWTIEYNNIHHNKNGLSVPNASTVRGNAIHHNVGIAACQTAIDCGGGYGGYQSHDVLLDSNEIAFNGYEQKFLDSRNVVFRNNYLHDNLGDAIWYDGQNTGAVVERNIAVNNGRHGIDYEGGLGATIRTNAVSGNRENGLFISTSQNVDIVGNTVVHNGAGGVTLFAGCSAIVSQPWLDLKNVQTHDNTIQTPGTPNSYAAGLLYDGGCSQAQLDAYYNGSKGLTFARNTYTVPNLTGAWWLWNGLKTWAQWQALGQDVTGSLSLDGQTGLAARYPKDAGIGSDPAVLFVEDFEEGSIAGVAARWSSDARNASALDSDVPAGSVAGSHAIAMPRTAGNTGASFFKGFVTDQATMYVRFYIKYDVVPHHSGVWMGGEDIGNGGAPLFPDPHAGVQPCRTAAGPGQCTDKAAWFWSSAEQSPFGYFDSYTAALNQHPDGTGTYWGNLLTGNPANTITPNVWTCVEHMIRVNDPGDTNGELALWLDGVKVSHVGKGFPGGSWAGGIFTQGSGAPFAGLEWRDTTHFGINYIWLQNYTDAVGVTNTVKYDHVVAATQRIGCMAP